MRSVVGVSQLWSRWHLYRDWGRRRRRRMRCYPRLSARARLCRRRNLQGLPGRVPAVRRRRLCCRRNSVPCIFRGAPDRQPPTEFFRAPFPTDMRVDGSGNLDMSDFPRPGPGSLGIDLVSLYVDALVADFSGFSNVGRGHLPFLGSAQLRPRPAPTPSSSSMSLVAIRRSAPPAHTPGATRRRATYTTAKPAYGSQRPPEIRC